MGLSKRLRQMQDAQRDRGWRIEWIPWQEDGKPEYVHNTPLSRAAGCGGVLLFFASIAAFAMKKAPAWSLAVGICGGAAIVLLGRAYAAWHRRRGWFPVTATCLDRQVRDFWARSEPGQRRKVYEFRLLCEYEHQGTVYQVTPEYRRLFSFRSLDSALNYLRKHIDDDGNCTLWVNPENPLQTHFRGGPKT